MTSPQTLQLHATCVAISGHGVLLRGVPGSGKSDLALRLIDTPGYGIGNDLMRAELVGDDQIVVTRGIDVLMASAATPLAGLLEIRGLGIVNCPNRPEVALALVVDLQSKHHIERLPPGQDGQFEALGITLPRITIDAHEPSAPARIRAGLSVAVNSALDSRA